MKKRKEKSPVKQRKKSERKGETRTEMDNSALKLKGTFLNCKL